MTWIKKTKNKAILIFIWLFVFPQIAHSFSPESVNGTFQFPPRAPEIVFKIDRGMSTGTSVLNLLDSLESERKAKEKIHKEQFESS